MGCLDLCHRPSACRRWYGRWHPPVSSTRRDAQCWLALLLLRVVENATDHTWRNVRHELDRTHLITVATADGKVAQRSATTGQKKLLAALNLDAPRKCVLSASRDARMPF